LGPPHDDGAIGAHEIGVDSGRGQDRITRNSVAAAS
jgi:hypothetical protein